MRKEKQNTRLQRSNWKEGDQYFSVFLIPENVEQDQISTEQKT